MPLYSNLRFAKRCDTLLMISRRCFSNRFSIGLYAIELLFCILLFSKVLLKNKLAHFIYEKDLIVTGHVLHSSTGFMVSRSSVVDV